MNWKAFSIVVINFAFIVLPYNRLSSCGETPDPYDAYTSFFANDLSANRSFKPFYFLADHLWSVSVNSYDTIDARCTDWVRHYNGQFSVLEAHQFICKTKPEDLQSLYSVMSRRANTFITSRTIGALPTSLRHNPMAIVLLRRKDTAALRYILFARMTENPDDNEYWTTKQPEQQAKDRRSLDSLQTIALASYRSSKNAFIKMRYAYQAVKCAFYNGSNRECSQYATTLITDRKAAGCLYAEALSYKAGIDYREGRPYLAAYEFSRAFGLSDRKLPKYISLLYSVKTSDPKERDRCLSYCKNNAERANLIGMFCLGSNKPELPTLQKMARLISNSDLLEVLTLREINKIEEHYFSPRLHHKKGGLLLYYNESGIDDSRPDPRWKNETALLAAWSDQLVHDPASNNQGLYQTVSAYCNYMLEQNTKAGSCLDRAALLPATPALRSQQALTRLLITLNEKQTLDDTAEQQLLPSIEWLEKKALAEGKGRYIYERESNYIGEWQQYYRNLTTELLAKIYHDQHEPVKEILCIGAGETITHPSYESDYRPAATKDRLQEKFTADQLDTLWQILYPNGPGHSNWLSFLAKRFPMKKSDLVLARAQAYTREHRWNEALTWLARVKNKDTLKLYRDPFAQSLIDRQYSLFKEDSGAFNCISFVKKMRALSLKEKNGKATAQELYLLATGYYNMTFYGRAWETVRTERWGGYWADLPIGETLLEKDYYGAFTAEKYYRKAMVATTDKNQQAICLFMAAKCAQKQMRDNFDRSARRNKYFPALVRDYANTPFYREAFHTCSYLRDFVKHKP